MTTASGQARPPVERNRPPFPLRATGRWIPVRAHICAGRAPGSCRRRDSTLANRMKGMARPPARIRPARSGRAGRDSMRVAAEPERVEADSAARRSKAPCSRRRPLGMAFSERDGRAVGKLTSVADAGFTSRRDPEAAPTRNGPRLGMTSCGGQDRAGSASSRSRLASASAEGRAQQPRTPGR